MAGETQITVLLSSSFPAVYAPLVQEVSPRIRLLRLPEGDTALPEGGVEAEVLAWWGGPREHLAALRPKLPHLRWVQSPIAGVGDQRLHEVLGEHVTLTSAAGVYADMVAEHALTLMLALYRRLPELFAQQRVGHWQDLPTRTLAGDILGIIGAGGIGRATARLAHAFGMRTIGIRRGESAVPELDQTCPRDDLPALLAASDVVLLATPLTDATRGMVDVAFLRTMRPSAVLINVARGPIVATDHLVQALREGWIAGAGLDVTDPEPLPPDHPLWQAPGVIITPHHANPTQLSDEPAVRRFCANLHRYLAGEPLIAVVDPHRGY